MTRVYLELLQKIGLVVKQDRPFVRGHVHIVGVYLPLASPFTCAGG